MVQLENEKSNEVDLAYIKLHKVPVDSLENEVIQDVINVRKKSQSTAVVEPKIPNSNTLE